MFEYTYKNHFKFGYETGDFYTNRTAPEQNFVAQFGSIEKKVQSWREANIQACKQIKQQAVGPIWVLFSGGMDSEICIRSFLEAKVPIRVAHLKFKKRENAHDTFYVEKLKTELDLNVNEFELDLEEYWESSEMLKLVDQIQCTSPILACHLWLADQLDGTPVMAQGEPHLKKVIDVDYIPGESPYLESPWELLESERLCSLYKHFIFQNRPAVPGFFQYMPEQFYSYLKFNPLLKSLVSNECVGKLGTRTSKNKIAHQYYPEVEFREKYTGFEKVDSYHTRKRSELANRYPHSDQNYKIEYTRLLKSLNPYES